GRDLVLEAVALVRSRHPDADPFVAPAALHIEDAERADDPFLDGGDEAPHIRGAALEVEHDVADALARPVIGELTAAPGVVNRKSGVGQVFGPCRRAGGIEGWVLKQPDELV